MAPAFQPGAPVQSHVAPIVSSLALRRPRRLGPLAARWRDLDDPLLSWPQPRALCWPQDLLSRRPARDGRRLRPRRGQSHLARCARGAPPLRTRARSRMDDAGAAANPAHALSPLLRPFQPVPRHGARRCAYARPRRARCHRTCCDGPFGSPAHPRGGLAMHRRQSPRAALFPRHAGSPAPCRLICEIAGVCACGINPPSALSPARAIVRWRPPRPPDAPQLRSRWRPAGRDSPPAPG